ncbi:FkbM family methyltransferase [Flavobacterium difficile]|uniref:FkbM family methyltransferase n=1 Tax=Flavobacterium difficile TaxID=2709659 RepID=A0ABX0I4U7_9FLAO|nr:FkbM family methyltransferase [Flavobacterium difficile]NHM01115.1 FkbM family methyltransferase [Flavobacterium difficile]
MITQLKKIIKRLIRYDAYGKSLRGNDALQYQRVKPWIKAKGDETLRLNYPLDQNSVVFDLGGYKGEFTEVIYNRYQPTIYVFEPIFAFYTIIQNKFATTPKVIPFQYGLAGKDCSIPISMSDNSSSVFLKTAETETIQLKSIVNFIQSNAITKVDLIKINIEGGEYEVLESLLDANLIGIFENIQVQFHDFLFENAKERMQAIQARLQETHVLTYQYEFVWENWKLK